MFHGGKVTNELVTHSTALTAKAYKMRLVSVSDDILQLNLAGYMNLGKFFLGLGLVGYSF